MRPFFIRSQAEQDNDPEELGLYSLYAAKMRGMYKWTVPEELSKMPEGFLEDCAFNYRGFGLIESKSQGWVAVPATASVLTPYGTPAVWNPAPAAHGSLLPDDIMPKDTPVFWQDQSPAEMIRPYVEAMQRAMIALKQNLVVMGQPIIIETTQASKMNGEILTTYIKAGDLYIPMIDKGVLGASVLDLKGEDHTQNLISTYRMLDSECLSILGISNPGSEKTSGVTTAETLAGAQECSMVTMHGLDLRRQWCERIKEKTGLVFTVDLGEGYNLTTKEEEKEEENVDPQEDE